MHRRAQGARRLARPGCSAGDRAWFANRARQPRHEPDHQGCLRLDNRAGPRRRERQLRCRRGQAASARGGQDAAVVRDRHLQSRLGQSLASRRDHAQGQVGLRARFPLSTRNLQRRNSMKQKATFYHAGCSVCVDAEQRFTSALDPAAFDVEIVHLGTDRSRLSEAEAARLLALQGPVPFSP